MTKTIACVIARTTSTRLPLKVLRRVNNKYRMIDFILQRLKAVKNIDKIYLCTSNEMVDDIMDDIAEDNQVEIYRGSPDSVIDRIIAVGEVENANNVIRITGDNVFTATEYLEGQISIHNEQDLDYTRVIGVPLGTTAEVIKFSALKKCYQNIDPKVSEYLLLYIFRPDIYKCGTISIDNLKNYSDYSVTVDTAEDLERTRKILDRYEHDPIGITTKRILAIINGHKLNNSTISNSDMIKMPYSKEISFLDFQKDMQKRIDSSEQYVLKM
jgi:spore coat polysaccharide biosynthesis protein SpsF